MLAADQSNAMMALLNTYLLRLLMPHSQPKTSTNWGIQESLVMFTSLWPSNICRQNYAPKIGSLKTHLPPHFLGNNTLKGRIHTYVYRNTRLFIILFVRHQGGSACNFSWVFATLLEVLLIKTQEEMHHFACWEGGEGLRGTKIVNKQFVTKLAFPIYIAEALFPPSLLLALRSIRKSPLPPTPPFSKTTCLLACKGA